MLGVCYHPYHQAVSLPVPQSRVIITITKTTSTAKKSYCHYQATTKQTACATKQSYRHRHPEVTSTAKQNDHSTKQSVLMTTKPLPLPQNRFIATTQQLLSLPPGSYRYCKAELSLPPSSYRHCCRASACAIRAVVATIKRLTLSLHPAVIVTTAEQVPVSPELLSLPSRG